MRGTFVNLGLSANKITQLRLYSSHIDQLEAEYAVFTYAGNTMDMTNHNFGSYLMIGSIGTLLLASIIYGVYSTFGAGSAKLTDQMEEHARLHDLGIAHTHKGNAMAIAHKNSGDHNHDAVST